MMMRLMNKTIFARRLNTGSPVNYTDVGRQAGQLAHDILGGKTIPSPSVLPPQRQRIALNLKTAKFLGITIAPDVVGIADEVY